MNGKRNAELVVLRTAVHASNWYEWASHVVRGLDSELSLAEIERVLSGPAHPDWAEPDALPQPMTQPWFEDALG